MLVYICSNWLEILGTMVGLIYLYLELKASIYLWLVSVVMPAIYMFVYFQHGLYADFGIQIYYLLAAIYGFAVWRFGKKREEKVLPITYTPVRNYAYLTISLLVLWALIAWILLTFTNSTVPFWDSFTTATSIVALWMLAHKYIEQWLVWVVVDAMYVGLYIYKDIYFTSGLYTLYTLIAVVGYLRWKKMMRNTPIAQSPMTDRG